MCLIFIFALSGIPAALGGGGGVSYDAEGSGLRMLKFRPYRRGETPAPQRLS